MKINGLHVSVALEILFFFVGAGLYWYLDGIIDTWLAILVVIIYTLISIGVFIVIDKKQKVALRDSGNKNSQG